MSRRLYETMFSLPCPITESQRATANGSLDKVRLVLFHRSGRKAYIESALELCSRLGREHSSGWVGQQSKRLALVRE